MRRAAISPSSTIHEHIVDVAAAFDIVLWPTVMDGKYADIEAMADDEITITLVSGSMRTDETVHLARLLRRKSQFMVSFGSCASEGCIPGLANLSSRKQIIDTAFTTSSTDNPTASARSGSTKCRRASSTCPNSSRFCGTLDQVVDVDYTIPAAHPSRSRSGRLSRPWSRRSTAPGRSPRRARFWAPENRPSATSAPASATSRRSIASSGSSRSRASIPRSASWSRACPATGPPPATAVAPLCPAVAAPCIGCYGAAEGVVDYGARLMSAYASVIEAPSPRR